MKLSGETISVPSTRLQGAPLAWAVAKALRLEVDVHVFTASGLVNLFSSKRDYLWPCVRFMKFDPLNHLTLNYVLETYRINLQRRTKEEESELAQPNPAFNWRALATIQGKHCTAHGFTFGEAALRCAVTGLLGDQVDVPKELL